MVTLLQIVIALGIFNVWLVRFNQPTAWRGGDAQTMREEFRVYGLSDTICTGVGILKVGAAVCLLAGIWLPVVAQVSAALIAALMLAAVLMHVKVADPVRKALPACGMLVLSVAVIILNY